MVELKNLFDSQIIDCIYNSDEEYPDKMLEECDDWQVFYHLSSMRKSILNWYEFDKDAKVLEIGAGFGAVTGVLCDNCRHVTVVEKNPARATAIMRRYQHRDNLEVIAMDINDFQCSEKYDYIVLLGNFEKICCQNYGEKYDEALNKLYGWLNLGGRLLLAVNNRAGVKNICGYMLDEELDSFEGANSEKFLYLDEWKKTIEKSNFHSCKIFYPLPDYKLTQAVYTDELPPKGNIGDRVIAYYPYERRRYVDDVKLSEKLIENNIFPFFSDSFLIECTTDENVSDIIFATVSTDRGEKHGFATVMKKDEVIKRTLGSNGTEALYEAYCNCERLRRRDISIISQKWDNNEIVMPNIREMSAMNYLIELVNAKQVIQIQWLFKQLWLNIIKSSELVEAENNSLLARNEEFDWGPILEFAYLDMVPMNCFYINEKLYYFDQEFKRENYPAKYVMFRVIRYSYLSVAKLEELFPLKEMRKQYGISSKMWEFFLRLEDEFIAENRRHNENRFFYKMVERRQCLLGEPIAEENALTQEDKKVRYSIGSGFGNLERNKEHEWYWAHENNAELFLQNKGDEREVYLTFRLVPPPGKEERKVKIYLDNQIIARELAPTKCEVKVFLQKNQTHRLSFHSFGEKTTVEGDGREFAVMLQDFTVCEDGTEYYSSPLLVGVQERQIELLREFLKICDKYKLRYFLVYGSLLGAVRHYGMIPWDDDVDIAMPRKDYEIFLKVCKKELSKDYFVQTPDNDLQCFYGGYAKLRSEKDCAMEEINIGHDCHQGIWIDIFPLDNVDKNIRRRRRQINRIRFCQELIFAKTYGEFNQGIRDIETDRWRRLQEIGKLFSQGYLREKLQEAFMQGNQYSADAVAFYAQYAGKRGAIVLKKNWIEKCLTVEFETLAMKIPQEWSKCLEVMEGENYQILPSPEERKPHHQVFYDLNVSYKEYQKKILLDELKLKQREVVVLGNGKVLEEFLKLYADRLQIAFLLNESNLRAGTLYYGFIVEKLEILNEIDKSKYSYVICNSLFREDEKVLQQYGIEDYYIFLGNKNISNAINLA